MKNGIWEGPFLKRFIDNSYYEGNYINNDAYGNLKYVDSYGRTTIGVWKDGNWNGQCKKIKKDRHMEGTKKNGKWEGKLTYNGVGNTFIGEWYNGTWNGNCTYSTNYCKDYSEIKKIVYSGIWKDGMPSGKNGKLTVTPQKGHTIMYEGEFSMGKASGKGFLYSIDTNGIKEPLDYGIWKDNILDKGSKTHIVKDSEKLLKKAVDYIKKKRLKQTIILPVGIS